MICSPGIWDINKSPGISGCNSWPLTPGLSYSPNFPGIPHFSLLRQSDSLPSHLSGRRIPCFRICLADRFLAFASCLYAYWLSTCFHICLYAYWLTEYLLSHLAFTPVGGRIPCYHICSANIKHAFEPCPREFDIILVFGGIPSQFFLIIMICSPGDLRHEQIPGDFRL